MTRETFHMLHRQARLGNLGSLTFQAGQLYYWFLENVYDLRFPHLGNDRHFGWPKCFDSLRQSTRNRLAWKRQSEYVAQITFCSICKTHHHRHHECHI